MEFYIVFDIITLLISLFFCVKHLKQVTKSARSIVFLLFFVFYALPLLFDCAFGLPEYNSQTRYYGFAISYNDSSTRILYDLFLLFSEFVITFFYRKNDKKNSYYFSTKTKSNRFLRIMLFLGMVSPFILTIIMPVNKMTCLVFQWRESGLFEYNSYSHTIEEFSYIGVCCSLLLLFEKPISRKKIHLEKILYLFFLYMSICSQGKRSIFFFTLFVALIIFIPGIKNGHKLFGSKKNCFLFTLLLFAAVALVMVISSLVVKVQERGYDSSDISTLYLSTRIDFFRDDRVRMAIYSMLNPDKINIVPHTGATIFCIPMWFWPLNHFAGLAGLDYPSYQDYFSTALQNSTQIGEYASFMTTCFPAELISNFGFWGFAVSPFLMVLFAKASSKSTFPSNVFILVLFVILQMYTIKYLNMLILFIFVYLLISYLWSKSKVTSKYGATSITTIR